MLWHPIQRHGCAAAGILYLTAARKDVQGQISPTTNQRDDRRWVKRLN